MKSLLTLFWNIDKRIWGDDINTNRYFASTCILFVAFIGICQGGGGTLQDWFGWDLNPVIQHSINLVLVIYTANLYESLIATNKASVGILRALLVLASFAIAFVTGYLIAILVLLAIALYLLMRIFVAGIFGSSDKKKFIIDEDGKKIELKEDLLGGTLSGSDGSKFNDNLDGTVTRL